MTAGHQEMQNVSCEQRGFLSKHNEHLGRNGDGSKFVQSSWYLGGRPSRALFRHCGVLSVSAVDGGTSGVSALESQSPSASPCRPTLSSPSASCHKAKTHDGIEGTIRQEESVWDFKINYRFRCELLGEKRCCECFNTPAMQNSL